ncbi:MAG: M20/M25/M40 family metallo-hydrolase [Alphaproteobacteria bacterium]|nr:M20/M25/M40 family metallo-hydrolase [Alphaproteobacteria bacterium]
MISCDTTFPPGAGYGAFADLMTEIFAPLGFAFERVSVPAALWSGEATQAAGERVNLIARRRGTARKDVAAIYFHVDTVPPGPGWTHPPLQLTRVGDRLFGRGTADMKGTIAATFAALGAARACGLPLAFDTDLLFCTDEEGGLYPGARYLAERGLIEGHVVCLNGGAAPRIWAGCFGSFDLAVRIAGRSAHSGDPVGGINAVEEAVPILAALRALQADVETRRSAMPAPPHYDGRPLTARLSVTAIQGGAKGSSLPGDCTLILNRRYPPEESFEDARRELEAAIRAAAAGTRALGVTIHLVGHLAPVADPDRGPYWPRWCDATALGFGYPRDSFRRWGSSTSSDMGFVHQAGIRDILLGGLARPGHGMHAADEFTTIDDVRGLARTLLAYLTDLAPRS